MNPIRHIQTSMSTAQELRTVGQGLESLDVEDFDLQGEENGYFALAIPRLRAEPADAAAAAGSAAALRHTLRLAWRTFTGQTASDALLSDPGPGVLRILFTPEGLLRLEAAGLAKRNTQPADTPALTKLAQVLRMVGERLDTRSGRLLRVCKRGGRISFEYATAAKDHVTEEWKLSELHKLWLHIARQRQAQSTHDAANAAPVPEEIRIAPLR